MRCEFFRLAATASRLCAGRRRGSREKMRRTPDASELRDVVRDAVGDSGRVSGSSKAVVENKIFTWRKADSSLS